MNERIASIVCPNCGANSTSRNRCDFCGSALVHFVDKNVTDLDGKFGKSVRIIPGLDLALEDNLNRQYSCSEDSLVITRIIPSKEDRTDAAANKKAWESIRTYEKFMAKHGAERKYDLPRGPLTPPCKTAIGTDYYEIISARDSTFGSNSMGLSVQDNGLTLRLPFIEKCRFNMKSADYWKERDFLSYDDYHSSRIEPNFRVVDTEGLFKVYKFSDGLFYLLDLGQDAGSAARIVTHYVEVLEKGGWWDIPRNIFTFDVETTVLNKGDIVLNPDSGNLIEKPKSDDTVSSSEKVSFWKKLFS